MNPRSSIPTCRSERGPRRHQQGPDRGPVHFKIPHCSSNAVLGKKPQVFHFGRDDLRQPPACGVQEVQSELQAALRRGVPHHLELLHEGPLRAPETAPGVELRTGVARHADRQPGVVHQVVLVDQEAIEILQDAQRLALRCSAERPLERPPQRRPALTPARRTPAAARLALVQGGKSAVR